MLLGGMLTCAEHGYRMIFELVDTHNDHVERELSGTIAALQPDGIILTPPHSENPLITNLLDQRRIPFARIGSLTPGSGFAIHMGDAGSAAQATQHLIGLGHKRIGFIAGAPDYNLSHWRVDGWRQAMAQAGLSDVGLCVPGDFSYESGREAATTLLNLNPAPTAIIASNDQMALATLDIAHERNLSVPHDFSLISFDNTPVVRFTTPQLTAIDQPVAATFSKAVELLINQATSPSLEPYLVPGSLVERASTAPPKA
jgi:LacI family transcriptional regulator